MYVTETLNLVAVRHSNGKSKNVTLQNLILLVYRILEVIARWILVRVSSLCPASLKSIRWTKEKM